MQCRTVQLVKGHCLCADTSVRTAAQHASLPPVGQNHVWHIVIGTFARVVIAYAITALGPHSTSLFIQAGCHIAQERSSMHAPYGALQVT